MQLKTLKLRRTVSQVDSLTRSMNHFFKSHPEYNRIICLWDLDGTLYDPNTKGAIPGAVETVRLLADHGVRHAVYSMGSEETRLTSFAATGLRRDDFFQIFAIPWPQKTPATWERLIAPFQADGAFVIYIGDSWVHDVAVGLSRADAVVYLQAGREPGKLGTPQNIQQYPVWVLDQVSELPRLFPAILADPYQGKNREDYSMHYIECRINWEDSWFKEVAVKGVKKGKRRHKRKKHNRPNYRKRYFFEEQSRRVRWSENAICFADSWPEDDLDSDSSAAPWDDIPIDPSDSVAAPWDDIPIGPSDSVAAPWDTWDEAREDAYEGEWPRTPADLRDLQWSEETDDLARLNAWECGEICGCGEDLTTPEEMADGCCSYCKATGKRTPRPIAYRCAR